MVTLIRSYVFFRHITEPNYQKLWLAKLSFMFFFFVGFIACMQLIFVGNQMSFLNILMAILLFGSMFVFFCEHLFINLIIDSQEKATAITQERRQKEHYLRNILDHLPMLISYIDLNQAYTFQNSAHEYWTGKKPHLSIGKNVRKVLGENNFRTIAEFLIQALNGHKQSTEQTLTDPIGNVHYMILDFIPDYDDEGRTKGCFFVMTDLTEKRRLVENLSIATSQVDDKRKLEFFLDQTGEGIIAFNQRGEITKVNKSLETLFEYQTKELIGHPISKIIPFQRQSDHHEINIESLFQIQIGHRHEMRALTKSGKKIHIEIAVAKISNDAKSSFMGLIQDISRRKETETELKKARELAEQAAKMKSDFLANVSHEIRTPLGGILGISELLQDRFRGKDGAKEIETILECGNTLMGLLNDVLDFSKLESKKVEAESLPTHLHDLVNQCAYLMDAKAAASGTRIFTDIAKDVPLWILTDTTKLRQILLNLISNAIKFTKDGTITVSVKVEKFQDNDLSLAFAVIDTGIGISQPQMEKLFQEFSQADASTARKYGGTGLGLAISKGLVEVLGGRIGVRSKEGAGSTFYFNILSKAHHTPREALPKKKQFTPLTFQKALVADDNSVNRKVLGAFLNHFGVRFDEVISGQEVLENLKRQHYDFLLLDCFMPDMDGFETARQIRMRPEYNNLIIIAVTGVTQEEEIKKCYEAGMNYYLCKPILKEKLFELLSMIDNKRKAS